MGAFLGGKYFKMSWAELAQKQQSSYFLNHNEPLKRGHVNYLELFAAYWALFKWKREVAGHLVVLHIDSMVALYCLETMSSKTLVFIPLLRVIAKILMRHDIKLKLTYISTTLRPTSSRIVYPGEAWVSGPCYRDRMVPPAPIPQGGL
jgi:hypothetical protein